MTTSQQARAIGVAPLPEPGPPPDHRPTRPLTVGLPPPSGIPWTSVRRWAVGVVAALTALGCLGAAGLAVMLGRGAGAGHVVAAALDGRVWSELHLVGGTGVVTVRATDLGSLLYQVSTPPDGDAVPRVVDRDGRLELHLVPTDQPGPSAVDILLSTRVRWEIRLSGGAVEQVVDMSGGTLTAVDFAAGATRIELRLPPPQGTTPVRLGAGASELMVYTPAGVPVQARFRNGAGQAIIDGESHSGIAAGTELATADWDHTQDRYAIDSGGLGSLTVARG